MLNLSSSGCDPTRTSSGWTPLEADHKLQPANSAWGCRMLTARAVFAHVILIATTLFFGPVGKAAEPEKPNIVLVLVDNLGWGELGAYGGGVLRGTPTPRLDELAAEGFRLTNFNVESECVPTRAALLTGRHPLRSGTLRSVPPGQPQGLVGWEITLAEVLAAQGYATAHYGKWHLGDVDGPAFRLIRASTNGTESQEPTM